MKFRSKHGEIRVALVHGGHTAVIGEDWRELDPMFHAEALALGAEVDKGNFSAEKPKPAEAANPQANSEVTHDAAYRNALVTMLTRAEEADFTNAGLPDIRQVSKLVGFQARKEDVYRVFREMRAEAEASAAADAAAGEGGQKADAAVGDGAQGAEGASESTDGGKAAIE